MADSENTTPERSKITVDRAAEDDLSLAVHAMQGIFWALDMLVVNHAADGIAFEEKRKNGIAGLIIAGELLAEEIGNRV
jgi:Pyruvate/2-oxoacid:ferredoxin oxidoreductase gamma subunit